MTIATEDLRYRELMPQDAGAVYALYRRAVADTPVGFLSHHTPATISLVLEQAGTSASVGAWRGPELVGYVLMSRIERAPDSPFPLLRRVRESGQPVLMNRGTVIAPQWRAAGLASRLIVERKALSSARGIEHVLMLIAENNLASVRLATGSGAMIAGLERDEFCDNFVGYSGVFSTDPTMTGEARVPIADLGEVRGKVMAGWLGVRLEAGADLVLRRCPDFGGD